jgi:hypothetical protein
MLLSKHLRTSAIHKYHALEAAMILDLLSLAAAYAVGCCRDVGTSLRVIALAAGVLVYILIHMVFFTLEHSEGDDKSMKKKRKLLLLLAILAATITYQAGLTPPGAFWQEGQAAGYAVLATNYPPRYTVFFYCNAASFMSSIPSSSSSSTPTSTSSASSATCSTCAPWPACSASPVPTPPPHANISRGDRGFDYCVCLRRATARRTLVSQKQIQDTQ